MKTKIICGVIGMGVGEKHLIALNNNRHVKVKSVCDFDREKINLGKIKYPNVKFFYKDKEILNDKSINLVSIASYDDYHYKQVINAIENKKNIIVEKPLCLNEREFLKIKKKIKKKSKH